MGDSAVMLIVEKELSRGIESIELVPVVLGSETVLVPVSILVGRTPGKTMLVTGGMDGDEYAGIEAAYHLISRYQSGNFSGRMIVVPVVNVPGYNVGTSKNPMDHRFPKFFFPGDTFGTPTEQLVDWLVRKCVAGADAWYDLHGGASDEGLNPFLWTYRTGSRTLKSYTQTLEQQTPFSTILSERPWWLAKQERLGKRGCWYVLAESGARGEVKAEDVERHVLGVESAMRVLGMLPEQPIVSMKREVFKNVVVVSAPFDGIWHPTSFSSNTLKRGDSLGFVSRTEEAIKHPILVPKSGVRLWWKETSNMERGDVLCAVGY